MDYKKSELLNIFSVFIKPYNAPKGDIASLLYACLFGIFVAGFLVYFKPFDIDNASYADKPFTIAFFGMISSLVFILLFYLLPKSIPKIYSDRYWKVWHQIFLLVIAMLLIATFNGLYINYLNSLSFSWSNYLQIISWTFALGSIPMSIIVLLDYNRKLKQHLTYATDIASKFHLEGPLETDDIISILDNKDEFTVKGDKILYLEANGNYVSVFEFSDDTITKKVVRTSLSKTEMSNNLPYIVRCHRSYIVNLRKVIRVSGNAQGLKLHMAESDLIIPVSRNYISVIQAFFNDVI